MDLRNFVENQKRRLLDDYINVIRNKIHDLSVVIWRDDGIDVFADQHAGNVKPFCYSRIWGPLTVADASLSQFILPSLPGVSNIIVGREGAFWWDEVNVACFSNWSISQPGSATVPAPGGLLDSAFLQNGGAISDVRTGINDGTSSQPVQPIGFDLVLYDKKRTCVMHDEKLPKELFNGARLTNKKLVEPVRFDPNSEIEPRLYLNYPLLSQLMSFSAGGHTFQTNRYMWINIMFKGHIAIED